MLLMSSTCCVLATSNWASAIFFFAAGVPWAWMACGSAAAMGATQRAATMQSAANPQMDSRLAKLKPLRTMIGIGFLTRLKQYPPADQHVAFQHEQHGEEQQQHRGEAQDLPGKFQVAAITREDIHPAAQHQQQRDQYQE